MKAIAATALYLGTAIICFLVAVRPVRRPGALQKQRTAWMLVCITLATLGLFRPFEVHSLITGLFRSAAMDSGWYAQRGEQQMSLLLVLGFFAAVAAGFFLFETRRWHAAARLGVVATMYLFALLVLNLLSLHGLDELLGRSVAGLPLRWMLDLAGLGTVVAAAFWFRSAASQAPRR